MSTLYIANTGVTGTGGVWKANDSQYQYQYTNFTPGEDVNLDLVSFKTYPYEAYTPPSNFQVGLYSSSTDPSTPGSIISYLSGPSSPAGDAYNNYSPTGATTLRAGTQYWLGFTLSSNTGSINERVRVGINSGNYTTLGSGWSANLTQRYVARQGAGGTGTPNAMVSGAIVYSLYATPAAVCFVKGTQIRVEGGIEQPIEKLRVGDIVFTSKGLLPIKWVAKRIIVRNITPEHKYIDSLPIRIEAGSMAHGLPTQDLLVSAAHGIYADGRIVTASCLVNGINIYKDSGSSHSVAISYFHLEFDEEVFVIANGAMACSYVNTGNRRSFDNYAEFISLYANVDCTASKVISTQARNRPSMEGHKQRVRRSWQAA